MIIYAATNDYLAEIELTQIKKFEKEFFEFMDTHYPDVGKSIKETGKLEEAAEKQLQEGIRLCKEAFLKLAVS